MKPFIEFIKETYANDIEADSRLSRNTTVNHLHYARMFKNAKRYKSSSPDHIIYHVSDGSLHKHMWVHKRTGSVDFILKSTAVEGKVPNETLHHDIHIVSREGGPRLGKTAFHDMWSGRVGGRYGVTVHNNQSPGAIKLHKQIRKEFGDKVTYHTYDPETKRASHYSTGVAASFDTPEQLRRKLLPIEIVAFHPAKYRLKQPQQPLT